MRPLKINLVFRALPHIFSFLSSAFLRFTWEYLVNLMALLSMSDVIVLNRGGEEKAYYVDTVGFQEAKRFLNPPIRKRKPPRQER